LKEKVFLCCLAPRGIVAAAVASIFSLEVIAKHSSAEPGSVGAQLAASAAEMPALVFMVIVGTVLIYGLAAAPVARKLGLASANPQGVLFAGTPAWAVQAGKILQEEGHQVLFVDTSRRGIAKARMAGVPTCLANILSEFVEEEVELDGLGKLLAVTPNDEVNSLSALEFRHVFGQQNVFRLQPEDESSPGGERRGASAEHRGQSMFPSTPTSSELVGLSLRGAEVKRSRLTEEFSYDHLKFLYEGTFIPLFVLKENGNLHIMDDGGSDPVAGDTVLVLVDPAQERPKSDSSPKPKATMA